MRIEQIKNKINLIQNIADLSEALELSSAIKAKKIKKLTLASRPFVKKSLEILMKVQKIHEEFFPFQKIKEKTNKILVIIFSSDKGFCGLYNKVILKYSEKEIENLKKENEIELITIGKKATNFFKKKNFPIIEEFSDIKEFEEKKKSKELFQKLKELFKSREYKKVFFFCVHYFTPFYQKPRKIQIFPIERKRIREIIKEITGEEIEVKKLNYIFEPSVEEVFAEISSILMEFEIYHAILEARTSEEVTRMMAMKRARESAQEIIKNLTLLYNKERQNKITTEVCEITFAKEAII